MAVYRPVCICPDCGKPFEEVHKQYDPSVVFVGDTFMYYDFDGHVCERKEEEVE